MTTPAEIGADAEPIERDEAAVPTEGAQEARRHGVVLDHLDRRGAARDVDDRRAGGVRQATERHLAAVVEPVEARLRHRPPRGEILGAHGRGVVERSRSG